jgi:hypothetical protein
VKLGVQLQDKAAYGGYIKDFWNDSVDISEVGRYPIYCQRPASSPPWGVETFIRGVDYVIDLDFNLILIATNVWYILHQLNRTRSNPQFDYIQDVTSITTQVPPSFSQILLPNHPPSSLFDRPSTTTPSSERTRRI